MIVLAFSTSDEGTFGEQLGVGQDAFVLPGLSGLPGLPGLPGGLLGQGSGLPAPARRFILMVGDEDLFIRRGGESRKSAGWSFTAKRKNIQELYN